MTGPNWHCFTITCVLCSSSLETRCSQPCSHLLDIDNLQSICALPDFLLDFHEVLDMLVNNTGITFPLPSL